jgi:hypothetical protein
MTKLSELEATAMALRLKLAIQIAANRKNPLPHPLVTLQGWRKGLEVPVRRSRRRQAV